MIKKTFLSLFSAAFSASLMAADIFPPAWSVGDIWQVKVKKYLAVTEGRESTDREVQEFTKVYQILSIDDVGGRPAYKVRIVLNGNATTVVARIDQERRYLIDYEVVGGSGIRQIGENKTAPRDSVVGAIPGSANCLLDFLVFPIPNTNEDRLVVAPDENDISGYHQKIIFLPGIADVTWTKTDGESTTAIHSQVWKAGDKWPESAMKKAPSEAGVLEVEIVETLIR